MKRTLNLLWALLLTMVFVGCGPRIIPIQRPDNKPNTEQDNNKDENTEE